jgi:arginine-tRNA-protein transferase
LGDANAYGWQESRTHVGAVVRQPSPSKEPMSIRAAFLESRRTPCVYLHGQEALCEELLVEEIDEDLLSMLIENGYRHFGRFFFRPCCEGCHACVPIRIPTHDFRYPRSARKLFVRNADLSVDVVTPEPTVEAFHLYRQHKRRFADAPTGDVEPNYERFVDSFFHPFPFSYALRIRHGDRLVCMSHFDLTGRVLSAVYCYYDLDYLDRSLGRFAIYKLIEYAADRGVPHVYLGFYIDQNDHMNYKRHIRPNQILLTEGLWTTFVDDRNRQVLAAEHIARGFVPRYRLGHKTEADTESADAANCQPET